MTSFVQKRLPSDYIKVSLEVYNFAWIFMKMGALFDLSDPYFIYGHINPASGSSVLFSDMVTWPLKYDGRNSLKLTGTTSFSFFSKLSSSESRKSSSLKWVGYLLSSAHQVIEDRHDARTRIICSLAPPLFNCDHTKAELITSWSVLL